MSDIDSLAVVQARQTLRCRLSPAAPPRQYTFGLNDKILLFGTLGNLRKITSTCNAGIAFAVVQRMKKRFLGLSPPHALVLSYIGLPSSALCR